MTTLVLLLAGLASLGLPVAPAAAASASSCRGTHWLGAWATSPSDGLGPSLVDRTVRLVIRPTLGGRRVRLRFSNRFGSAPVTLGQVTVGRRLAGAAAVPGSLRTLRFGRSRTATIPAGGELGSDALAFRLAAFEDLVVSAHVVGATGPVTEHVFAFQTSHASPAGSGDHTRDESAGAFPQTLTSWPLLTDLEVRAPRRVGAVVALGDSITDGFGSPADASSRYPDLLARRLATESGAPALAVQNAGISGNQILEPPPQPIFGPRLLDRLASDAVDQAGARTVILLEGTNDLGFGVLATAPEVIAGIQLTIDRLRAAGLRVLLGTQTPCTGFAFGAHGTPAAIAARNEINDWIRTSGQADGVIDFHAALRDPAQPDQLLPAFDSGDHLHPNAAGYQAMADAIDLQLLAGGTCAR